MNISEMYPFCHAYVLKIILFEFRSDTVAAFALLRFCQHNERRASKLSKTQQQGRLISAQTSPFPTPIQATQSSYK